MKNIIEIHKLERLAENNSHTRQLYKSIELYNRVLQLKKTLNNKVGQVRTLNSIGTLYHELGEKSKGIEYHNELISLLDQMQNSSIKKEFFMNLFEFYRSRDINEMTEKLSDRLNCL